MPTINKNSSYIISNIICIFLEADFVWVEKWTTVFPIPQLILYLN